jgi:hypothetical protein
MKKIDVAQAISIVANFGAIVGIGFLAYETHQNTQAIDGMTVQAIAEQGMTASFIAIQNRELQLAYQRAGRGLEYMTPEDFSVLSWWYSGVMRMQENRYRQVTLGTVGGGVTDLMGGGASAYRHPVFGLYWQRHRDEYPKDFVEWVDANLIPLVQDSFASTPDLLLPEARDAVARK